MRDIAAMGDIDQEVFDVRDHIKYTHAYTHAYTRMYTYMHAYMPSSTSVILTAEYAEWKYGRRNPGLA